MGSLVQVEVFWNEFHDREKNKSNGPGCRGYFFLQKLSNRQHAVNKMRQFLFSQLHRIQPAGRDE